MLSSNQHPANKQQWIQVLADYMRYVFSRSEGLKKLERNQLIKLCLIYKLHELTKEAQGQVDFLSSFQQIAASFGAIQGIDYDCNSDDINQGIFDDSGITSALIGEDPPSSHGTDNRDVVDLCAMDSTVAMIIKTLMEAEDTTISDRELNGNKSKINEILLTLRSLKERTSRSGVPLYETLKHLDSLLSARDDAIEYATQSSFDLIINSLDPDALAVKLDKKRFRSKTSYKAAIFDMYSDKYLQLSLYHQQGRFVKDCRANYKCKMKQYGL